MQVVLASSQRMPQQSDILEYTQSIWMKLACFENEPRRYSVLFNPEEETLEKALIVAQGRFSAFICMDIFYQFKNCLKKKSIGTSEYKDKACFFGWLPVMYFPTKN